MSKFRRTFRRSWKFIAIWFGLLAIAITQKGKSFCQNRTDNLCEDIALAAHSSISFVEEYSIAILSVAIVLLIIRVVSPLFSSENKKEDGFKNYPGQYDKQLIQLTGKVERIFYNSIREKLKRKSTDLIRTMTKNSDQTFRHIHQRFLVSSPMLRKNELLLVEHNPNFGKASIKKGQWLQLQGEYIHRRSQRRSSFGKGLTFYGRIHSTYSPKGYIRPLGRKQPMLLNKVVEVVPQSNDSNN